MNNEFGETKNTFVIDFIHSDYCGYLIQIP